MQSIEYFYVLAVCRREGKPPFFLPLGRVVGIQSLPAPHLVAEMGLTINTLPHTFVLSDKLLGDRACLALAQQLNLPAITADRIWEGVVPDVVVRIIR